MANGFGYQVDAVAPTKGQGLMQGLSGLSNTVTEVMERRKAMARQEAAQTAAQEAYSSGDPNAIAKVVMQYPELQEQLTAAVGIRDEAAKREALDGFRGVLANRDNPQQALALLNERAERLTQQGRDASDTIRSRDLLMDAIASDDPAAIDSYFKDAELTYAGMAEPQEWKAYSRAGGADLPTSTQDRNALFAIIEDPSQPEWKRKAARIDLGLDPRAVGSSSQTIAEEGKTDLVAESEGRIAGEKAGASERSRLEEQEKLRPRIEAAIKKAQVEAASEGQTAVELAQAKAAMPGLNETIEGLKELAPLATYTWGGKLWNETVKQLGFGATEGSTARAKYSSIIDNQVLPLLRQVFGSQFTAEEGDRLRATMGDPDSTPAEKVAQLEAFVEQKYRDIEAKERELQADSPPVEGAKQAPDGNWYVERDGKFYRVDA